jgi:effector-binding domain-containing protein
MADNPSPTMMLMVLNGFSQTCNLILLREVMPKKTCLNELTLAQIHQEIYHSASLTAAAARLGVKDTTLASHLGKFEHQGNVLTYKFLKGIPLANGSDTFGDRYQSLMVTSQVELKKFTFRQVHEAIQNSIKLTEAAGRLGVLSVTLVTHLGKFSYQGNSLSYKFLKEIPLENGADTFGACYESLMEAPRVDLKACTLRMVHEAIQKSRSLSEAAGRLGVSNATLASHLGKYLYQGSPSNYKILKGIPLENGADTFGECYESLMDASPVNLKLLTLRQVHDVIQQSTSLRDAATRFGVFYDTLSRHLGKFMHQGNSLTYEFLKGVSLDKGPEIFGDSYELLMDASRVNLNTLTLRQVHDAIHQSENLSKAATRLGVFAGTLALHLGKFIHGDHPLTYAALKGIPLENGPQVFGDCYESLMEATRVELKKLPLKLVHEMIHQSTSLLDAANRLGVTRTTLKSHLHCCLPQAIEGGVFCFLKKLTVEDAHLKYGFSYYLPTAELMGQPSDAMPSLMEGLEKGVDDEVMDTDVFDVSAWKKIRKRKNASSGLGYPTFFNQSDMRLKKSPVNPSVEFRPASQVGF